MEQMAHPSSTPLLVAEIGNTTAMFAVFSGTDPIDSLQVATAALSSPEAVGELLQPLLARHSLAADAVISSVVPRAGEAAGRWLLDILPGRVLAVDSTLNLPFRISYDPPSALGADRLSLCARCCMLEEEAAVIALDIGTAITFDVLSADRSYLGGLIMPGLELMASALHERTAQLPRVEVSRPERLMGLSTADCIRSGVVWGCVLQVEGLVRKIRGWLRSEHGEGYARVVATGGRAPLIVSMMEMPPLLDPHAVSRGARYLFELNRITVS
ncbi:MAG: type III pantothenate kinase [Pelodictyon luteolum]|uniref:Type III pantothenate kinase n=2 Tax=Pelodictyon luteolum TaxID=1100 RepID=COAX_CHLL3|nr:type III pantothenate kinase [Pelodictyon luteolum]Q3B314.1 RecName: Full=Type III pantothenate kinase; AltName: Full=PanK-III; AltName: Full=Pantothenic acid kinase [Pelodictyon luteolum DSM 273]ABB24267.1 pantothenate kinase [Pelodictyon luteolum DSM 273]KZK73937.1 MAG: type III pantothenate kinase [Pelodictyon luteolum]